MQRRSVDLPDPEEPISETTWPFGAAIETPRRTSSVPKLLCKSLTSMTGVLGSGTCGGTSLLLRVEVGRKSVACATGNWAFSAPGTSRDHGRRLASCRNRRRMQREAGTPTWSCFAARPCSEPASLPDPLRRCRPLPICDARPMDACLAKGADKRALVKEKTNGLAKVHRAGARLSGGCADNSNPGRPPAAGAGTPAESAVGR